MGEHGKSNIGDEGGDGTLLKTATTTKKKTTTAAAATMTTTIEKLERLASKQGEWGKLGAEKKLTLLEMMLENLSECGGGGGLLLRTASEASCQCLGHEGNGEDSILSDERHLQISVEYFMLSSILKQMLRHYAHTFEVLSGRGGAALTKDDMKITRSADGRYKARVFPFLPWEKMGGPLCKGAAEVYLDPEFVGGEDDVRIYDLDHFDRSRGKENTAMVVLGAGNQGFLTVADVLYCAFISNRVVLVKNHPLREHMDGLMKFLFRPLMEGGYVDFQSDGDFDKSALYSPLVSAVHMTGGKATHDAIVWGKSDDAKKRGGGDRLLRNAEMTSELGCVTPWIAAPCGYTRRELRSQALNLASAVYSNCSFNCNSPKIVVIDPEWKQREEFLDAVKLYLNSRNVPPAFYPGAERRWDSFRKEYPDALELGKGYQDGERRERRLTAPVLPWLYVELDADLSTEGGRRAAREEYAFRNEPFAPVLTVVALKCRSDKGDDFLSSATSFCNDYLFGCLSATLMTSTSGKESPQQRQQISRCLEQLRYGSIAVNCWSAMTYGVFGMPWGAHPGETLDDIQSGVGCVNGLFLIPHVQKGVLSISADTVIFPDEIDGTNVDAMRSSLGLRALADFVFKPGPVTLLKFISTQIRIPRRILRNVALVGIGAASALVFHRYYLRS